MRFLKRLTFRSKSHQDTEGLIELVQWNTISSEDELEAIEKESNDRPQILFKHSTRCGVSSMVLRRFERQSHQVLQGADFHMVDVIGTRSISNAVANRYGIMHQSPQLIVLKGEKTVFNNSHYGIATCDLASYL